MPYDFTLTTIVPASAQEIYEAWLDSLKHSEMTGGGEAVMSDEIGADVSAWEGYISGRNLELVPGERIVQSWRSSQFADEHEDSIITLTFEEVDGGTRVTLLHSNVPDEQTGYEESGWQTYYFEPMAAYFGEPRSAQADSETKPAARKPARKKAAKSAAKTAPRTAPETKPAATKAQSNPKAKSKPKSKSKSKAKSKVTSAAKAKSKPKAKSSAKAAGKAKSKRSVAAKAGAKRGKKAVGRRGGK
jgi:uncharacterized protein YndB with AHSA1/START domain